MKKVYLNKIVDGNFIRIGHLSAWNRTNIYLRQNITIGNRNLKFFVVEEIVLFLANESLQLFIQRLKHHLFFSQYKLSQSISFYSRVVQIISIRLMIFYHFFKVDIHDISNSQISNQRHSISRNFFFLYYYFLFTLPYWVLNQSFGIFLKGH